jgi:hypothetical protein
MTNLPAPYIFDMPLDEVEAGLELDGSINAIAGQSGSRVSRFGP